MTSDAASCVSRTDGGFGCCFVDGKSAQLSASIDNDGRYVSLFFYNNVGFCRD